MSLDSFSNNITSFIDVQMGDFISRVSTKYNIDADELTSMWNGGGTVETLKVEVPKVETPKVETPKVEVPKVETSKVETSKVNVKTPVNTCQHMWSKGARKGTLCGCQVKNPAKTYCVKHINQYKPTPTPTPSSSESNASSTAKVIRRNKTIDRLWHEESRMVFDSIDDRRIIGKYSDGVVSELTDADIQTCKQLGFVIKPAQQPSVPKSVPEPVVHKSQSTIDKIDEVESLLASMMVGGDDEELLEEEE